ncbi:flagellar FlbD family protein [Spirillospora sp. CA-253888]
MILLTRLNGPAFALNPDLIERADETPDTVITLVDGTKYLVEESLAEFVALLRRYRAELLADAEVLISSGAQRHADPGRVVRLAPRER